MTTIRPQSILMILLLAFFLIGGCAHKKEEGIQEEKSTTGSIILDNCLEAHGGLGSWLKYKTLTFDKTREGKPTEHHLVNLENRHTLVSTDDYTLGFDGKDVWVTPNREAFPGSSPRFFHNLYFYFFAFPFVLTDPGVSAVDKGGVTVGGNDYEMVEISFNTGVGDSPDDRYILYIDPETSLLSFIRYTVTFFSNDGDPKFSALAYDWQEVSGLRVPKKMTFRKWEADSLGSLRSEAYFEKVTFNAESPEGTVFEMPEGAFVDQK